MSDRQTYLRHPLEIAPLVFGLIFLGIVAAWGLFQLDLVSSGDAAWILPIVLIASGALGIVLAATKERRSRRRYENMYVSAPIGAPWPTGTDERLDDSLHDGLDDTGTTDYTLPTEHGVPTDDTTELTATEDTTELSATEDTTTEIRDPDDPADQSADADADYPVDPDHIDYPDQPGATR